MSQKASIGTISAQSDRLVVSANAARVTIRHEQRDDIELLASHPHNWAVSGNSVTQQNASSSGAGRDKSPLIVNHGSSAGGDLSLVNSYVNIGTVERGATVVGAVIGGLNWPAGTSDAAPPAAGIELDTLDVLVPENFGGSLDLRCEGPCFVELDGWRSGDANLAFVGIEKLDCGPIRTTGRCAVENSGGGELSIAELDASIVLLRKIGGADTEIDKLTTSMLLLEQMGAGDTTAYSGGATTTSISQSGPGKIRLHGDFSTFKAQTSHPERVKIRS